MEEEVMLRRPQIKWDKGTGNDDAQINIFLVTQTHANNCHNHAQPTIKSKLKVNFNFSLNKQI